MTLVACLNIPQRAARQQVVSRSKDPLSSNFEKIALTNAFLKKKVCEVIVFKAHPCLYLTF